jgi:ribosomal-protein-alanine N-acetyltransferase
MTHSLETERLILRRPTLDDAEALATAINHPEIAKFTLNIPHPYSVEDAVSFIKLSQDPVRDKTQRDFSIFLKDSGELVGGLGLMDIHAKNKSAELGYWCTVNHWGEGIVTQACRRIIQYAFDELDLNRVFCMCNVDNFASVRIMEKCGMAFEGTARSENIKDGKPWDMHHYAILKSDTPPEGKQPVHLETKRLILRSPKFSDLGNMVEPINHPEISKFSAHIKYPFTIDDAYEWYRQRSWTEHNWGHITLLIFLKETDELIGSIWFRANSHHRKADLAYWIAAKHWNKGYATEACREMLRYGFGDLGFERIAAGVIVGNGASTRVVEKLGMKLEGTALKEWWDEGRQIDCHHYVIYREDKPG